MKNTRKILIVEDDEVLASVYETRLGMEGFYSKQVNNGEEALSAIQDYRPDLILLDVMMPRISGFDVLDIIRNTPSIANTQVIMLTALGQESDIERAKKLGADGYLVKSEVAVGDVVKKVKTQLNIK